MGAVTVGIHEGGCLCGATRYRTEGEPLRVTICHCRFCQRATGAAFMVEPIFRLENVSVTRGVPSIYTQHLDGQRQAPLHPFLFDVRDEAVCHLRAVSGHLRHL